MLKHRFSGLAPHAIWLVALALLWLAETLLVSISGPLKSWPELDFIDLLSEGLVLVFLVYCFLLVLSSRAPGGVTHLFALGLLSLLLAFNHDVLDEIWHIERWEALHSWLEFFPLGLLLVTLGLYGWRQEQLTINRHFRRRQSVLGPLRQFDHTTGSATLPHLCQLLDQHDDVRAVLVIELSESDRLQRHHGHNNHDDVLLKVNEAILLNLRSDELLCHLGAGLFFIALKGDDLDDRQSRLAQHLNGLTLWLDDLPVSLTCQLQRLPPRSAAVHGFIQDHYRVAG